MKEILTLFRFRVMLCDRKGVIEKFNEIEVKDSIIVEKGQNKS